MITNRFQDEAEFLEQALAAFHETTGLRLELETQNQRNQPRNGVNAFLRLRNPNVQHRFIAEIKRRINNAMLGTIRNRFDGFAQPGCLITTYVNPKMAERLKALDIAFIDTVGNAYLNAPPVLIYVKGNRPTDAAETPRENRAFQATGLKVVFAFLCRPELADATYREIADLTDVALGTVNWVIRDLKNLDFLAAAQKGRRIIRNEKELLDRWVAAYPDQLRPKLVIGRFQAADPDWWKNTAPLEKDEAYFGGEVAAAKLTHYLRPGRITVYCRNKPTDLIIKQRLRKNPNGETELLRVFWDKTFDGKEPALVPAFLAYADLMATGNARNIETAQILYEREIAERFRED